MKRNYLYVLFTFVTACVQSNQQTVNQTTVRDTSAISIRKDITPEEPEGDELMEMSIDSAMGVRLNWIDSVAYIALQSSDNPLFQYEIKDSSIAWHWDRLVFSDTAAYIALQVGHREDDDEFPHFATSGWLYVDTLSGDVYEYRVATDSLIKLSTTPDQHTGSVTQ